MSDDLISRQAAIAEFSCCQLTPDGGIDANYAIDFLKQLPSAEPERKKGKWLIHPKNAYCPDREEKTCSACGMSFVDLEVANYCPNCGADMRGDQDETD